MRHIKLIKQFHNLHKEKTPLILYNVWDAATAKAAENSGAKALATGSWSIAAAHGYDDGQKIPFEFMKMIVTRIVHTSNIPVTVDFECGYATCLEGLKANFNELIAIGVSGINFEDQFINQNRLRSIAEQCERIATLRATAEEANIPVFINSRTDLFLKEPNAENHIKLVDEAVARGAAYKRHGADGYFVPGTLDVTIISSICKQLDIPVNVMAHSNLMDVSKYQQAGACRISYGPHPFTHLMNQFQTSCKMALQSN